MSDKSEVRWVSGAEGEAFGFIDTLKRAVALVQAEQAKCGPDRVGDAVWFDTDIDRLNALIEKQSFGAQEGREAEDPYLDACETMDDGVHALVNALGMSMEYFDGEGAQAYETAEGLKRIAAMLEPLGLKYDPEEGCITHPSASLPQGLSDLIYWCRKIGWPMVSRDTQPVVDGMQSALELVERSIAGHSDPEPYEFNGCQVAKIDEFGRAICEGNPDLKVGDWLFPEKAARAQHPGTPAARWRENGEPDPHGDRYNGERSALCRGDVTDDELANEVYLYPNIGNLTAAKERIRWLSRRLESHHADLLKIHRVAAHVAGVEPPTDDDHLTVKRVKQMAMLINQLSEPKAGSGVAAAYACPVGCGCLWRDNHDGTMSLYGPRSQSCDVCEPLPLDELLPLYTHSQPAQQGSVPDAVSEFVSAVRSINRSSHHQIQIPGDDEPCFWQRKEWIDWILELADQVEASLSATTPQPEGDGNV